MELTREAYQEAKLNFTLSPWTERLQAVHQRIQDFAITADRQYDLIISNPPFFENQFKTKDALRKIARHTDSLAFADLIAITARLLAPEGLFYVLLPVHAVVRFSALASAAGFYPIKETGIRGYEHSQPRVAALTFSRGRNACIKDSMTVYQAAGIYTQESKSYLSPFLLRFAENGDSKRSERKGS